MARDHALAGAVAGGIYGPGWHHIGGKVLYLMNDILAYEDRHRRKGG